VVAVRLGIYQVAHHTEFGNLIPPLDRFFRHLGGFNHDDAFRGGDEAAVGAAEAGFDIDIWGDFFHFSLL